MHGFSTLWLPSFLHTPDLPGLSTSFPAWKKERKQRAHASIEREQRKTKKKPAAAQCSRLVTHVNTLWPLRCLSARIGRDAEGSSRYGRRCGLQGLAALSTHPLSQKNTIYLACRVSERSVGCQSGHLVQVLTLRSDARGPSSAA